MLLELRVSNFAIIENLNIEFKKGLNILSGETGAGKSVLLKSLSLLMGGKASTDIVRTGCRQAVIEGFFNIQNRQDISDRLTEMGIEIEDQQLIVRRIISAEDKSKIYMNGSLISLSHLKEIVAPLIEVAGHSTPLIEMTSQSENRHLLSKSYHMDLLDQFSNCWELRHQYLKIYSDLGQCKNDLRTVEETNKIKIQRLDFLIFQREEIQSLKLKPGDETKLENEVRRLKNTQKLNEFFNRSEEALYSDESSAITRIDSILRKAHELISLDPHLESQFQLLTQAKENILSYLYDIRGYVEKLDRDPYHLEALEQRLSDFRKLQKKYGSTSEEILFFLSKINMEIAQIENSETHIEELKKKMNQLTTELISVGEHLHQKRVEGAKTLAHSVNLELLDLNMKGVTFHISVQKSSSPLQTGLTDLEFMSQTSAKDIKRPLSKFASGGELSRILLSLKKVLGAGLYPHTYLFDEVDTGVSGQTAEKVGRKLKTIAKGQQVICVTHLPQVAAFGDTHFYIEKSPAHDSVAMIVSELENKKRINEIARLISGEKVTKTSLAHAHQLIQSAQSQP